MNELQKLPKIQDACLKDLVVLVRVDHNVVKKGRISDAYRIDCTIPTILQVLKKGGKLILMTHIGRPYDKVTKTITISPEEDVHPIVEYLHHKYGLKCVIPKCKPVGEQGYMDLGNSQELVNELREGKIDAIYLPNTRFFAGEENKGELKKQLGKELASLADIYVNDAFGSWQPHASTIEPVKYLPSYAGLLMQKELEHLTDIFYPQKPLTAVVAGSKFDTKIKTLEVLIKEVDYLILGGVILNAYLAVKYGISIKGLSEEDLKIAADFVTLTNKYPGRVLEPSHIVESDTIEGKFANQYRNHATAKLTRGTQLNYILDVGKESFQDQKLQDIIKQSKTIFINAVMGFTPHFTEGTIGMYSLIHSNKSALKLYGGGDTLQEFKNLLAEQYLNALNDTHYYFFTGGGTILTAIEQGSPWKLETVAALLRGDTQQS